MTHSRAIFAAGCFWGVQRKFDLIEGVVSTTAGYIGGTVEHPSYEVVCSGSSGHCEAVEVVFDPRRVDYPLLLATFAELIGEGELEGRKEQYRLALFYSDDLQRQEAQLFRHNHPQLPNFSIEPAAPFYAAEEYHQHYLKKKRWR